MNLLIHKSQAAFHTSPFNSWAMVTFTPMMNPEMTFFLSRLELSHAFANAHPSLKALVLGAKHMGRSRFRLEEDMLLFALVAHFGTKNWSRISTMIHSRSPRQCRERWTNFLDPTFRSGDWLPQEDELLEAKVIEYGTKWDLIATFFQGRAPLSLRNRHAMNNRRRRKEERSQMSTLVNTDNKPEPEERSDLPWSFSSEDDIPPLSPVSFS
jgi:hypothetical protein